ncbi:unnamed protein product [Lupinus luteus]|uniref:Peptidase A1 domain-containing protein n=1 Tax=Lupinus luteus TaxID=3873 RepID=A0AAV1Y4Q0_LUPLU
MEKTYYSLIVLLFCLCDISLIEGFGFSVDLFHRDSPKSPFYLSSETHYERVAKTIHRSINYANRFNNPSFSIKSIESDVLPDRGEYLMSYSIGTPPVKILGIVDTGSDILWLQCQPCHPWALSLDTLTLGSTNGSAVSFPKIIIGCGKSNTLVFQGEGSGIVGLGNGPVSLITQLGSSIQGKFSYCLGPLFSGTNSSSKLNFGDDAVVSGDGVVSTPIFPDRIGYGDGSQSEGDLSLDTITLSSSKGSTVSFPKTVIGCGTSNTLGNQGAGSGIVGLGNGPVSLITQLGYSIQGKFAYCLGPLLSGTKSASKLNFGEDAVVSGAGTVSTPLFLDKVFYFLNLEAFSVGNKRVEFGRSSSSRGGSGNIIIDSGTTLTLLPEAVYTELESTIAAAITLERVKSPISKLNLCYKVPSGENLEVPVITAHFTGADIKLNALNTFLQVNEDAICFSFAPTNQAVSIFGNVAHQNFLVGYDLQNKSLSFKPTDCTQQ